MQKTCAPTSIFVSMIRTKRINAGLASSVKAKFFNSLSCNSSHQSSADLPVRCVSDFQMTEFSHSMVIVTIATTKTQKPADRQTIYPPFSSPSARRLSPPALRQQRPFSLKQRQPWRPSQPPTAHHRPFSSTRPPRRGQTSLQMYPMW